MSRGERGAASLLAMALAGLLVLLTLGGAAVIGVVHAHRAAQSAADLAALAGARALADGGAGCARAAAVASANGALVTHCTAAGWDLRVVVEVSGPTWWGHRTRLAAEARAGPAP
ncbi:MAG: hypothetical protein R2731_09310 [Nocardioides sp.]